MDILLLVLTALAAVLVVGLIVTGRWSRARSALGPAAVPVVEGRAVVVLDVEGGDPETPAVRRLVRETATRTFAALPDVEEVEVRSRTGRVLGRAERRPPEPREIALPEHLFEPRAPRPSGPDLAGHLTELPGPFPGEDRVTAPAGAPAPARPVADRFELSEAVRRALRDPDDPVDLVRAILEAAGIETEVSEGIILADDHAVVVIGARPGGIIDGAELSRAYLRVQRTGAPRGLVLTLGCLQPGEARRRQLLAPHVLHAGPGGIQRMADALTLGGNPLRFAAGPALAGPAAERSRLARAG